MNTSVSLFSQLLKRELQNLFLVERGQLVPGSNVFVRLKDQNSYVSALVTAMDQKLITMTPDGVSLVYDLNDVRGVVLDELPLVSDIAVGSKVIAFVKDDEPYKAGVVLRILDSSDKNIPNVLVKFGEDNEEVKPFEHIRLLKNVKNGGKSLTIIFDFLFRLLMISLFKKYPVLTER